MRSTVVSSSEITSVLSEVTSETAMSSSRRRRSSTEMASESASSSFEGRRPWMAVNWSRALAMSRSQRRSERGAQSWRRSSSSTAPWMRVHANCSSVAPLAGS